MLIPMPELPDVTVYVEALQRRVVDTPLQRIRLRSPFVLRSVSPRVSEVEGRRVLGVRRLGKRIVLVLEHDLFVVFHLMIAGRLRWEPPGAAPRNKAILALFEFEGGTLVFTEAGSKKRASLHLVQGEAALRDLAPRGLEVLETSFGEFRQVVCSEVHTLKRTLTDPHLLSGIGNAYSDEILHAAQLSPVRRIDQLDEDEMQRLYRATRDTLTHWIQRLREDTGEGFPTKVTAFREGMAVHGRYGKPCPRCGSPVQRIVYAERETNYCAPCQTGGKLLADRALSRLLGKDWPRSLEELERKLTP